MMIMSFLNECSPNNSSYYIDILPVLTWSVLACWNLQVSSAEIVCGLLLASWLFLTSFLYCFPLRSRLERKDVDLWRLRCAGDDKKTLVKVQPWYSIYSPKNNSTDSNHCRTKSKMQNFEHGVSRLWAQSSWMDSTGYNAGRRIPRTQ